VGQSRAEPIGLEENSNRDASSPGGSLNNAFIGNSISKSVGERHRRDAVLWMPPQSACCRQRLRLETKINYKLTEKIKDFKNDFKLHRSVGKKTAQ